MAHTPGPWTLHKYHGHVAIKAQCGHEAIINAAGHSCGSIGLHDEEQANARLIAAAPDLLEAAELACRALLHEYISDSKGNRPWLNTAVGEILSQAIKAAKGS
jgi:hypothetical protein